jgi:GNAT superfamily N-acetyltransferase
MALAVREAAVDEAEQIVPLYEWLFAAPGNRPPQWDAEAAAGRLRDAIAGERSAVLVAEAEDGSLAGLCTAYLELDSVRYGQRCWVEDLAVDPDRRSQGIGGRLLDAAEGWARERGASHFELDTGLAREEAQRFYERRGKPVKAYTYSWRL